MSRNRGKIKNGDLYQNDHRLIQAYQEATKLDDEGLEALCPSYIELSETTIRYRDETLLGEGGVKKVFRTFDNRTRRWVAMARPREDRGPEFYDLFVNEAWLTSSLNHPNIINVHDVGIDSSGHPFFTMDLKGNTTLSHFIQSKKRNQRALLRDFLKICDAISYAHSLEIIHLDLKPENIQTDTFGEVLVCDWGLGKIISDIEKSSPTSFDQTSLDNMTLVGEVKGSPGYMAPEQIERDAEKDHRTDIFSLGCILHAILTGDPPFQGDRHAMLEATSQGNIVDPSERFPTLKIPSSLSAVTLKALAKKPDDRYQSVSDLKEDVQRYMEGFSTNAEDTNLVRETCLFVSRNKTAVLIASLSLILLSVLSTLFFQKLDFLHQSVIEESQLAEKYATEAEVANELYIETLSNSEKQQHALSQSLMSSVKNLKNRGIFDTPMKSIRQALILANHAHTLNPESRSAKYELFALNLIQLNFQEALNYPLPLDHTRYGYMSFATAFPDFDYQGWNRPDLDTLCEFLEKARELEPNQSPVIERMLSYDAAVRPAGDSYHQAILEFLKYLNPGIENIELELNPQRLELTLRTQTPITLTSKPGGSEKCVLQYLKFRSLIVDSQGTFDLHQFNGLPVQKLDLTKCQNFTLTKPLVLPSLETIKIDPQKHSHDHLHEWINAVDDFQIVVSKDQPHN